MFGIGKKKKVEDCLDIAGRFELHESLKAVVKKGRLRPVKMSVGIPVKEESGQVLEEGRNSIFISDGKNVGLWSVDSLSSLFRGDEPAPSGDEISMHSLGFAPLFFEIESGLKLFLSESQHPPTDGALLEVFSALRRRPDGRSLGLLHDFVWMNVAFMLGKYRCSESLYTAIMKRMEQSVRMFKTGMSSRNYMNTIQNTFGQ